MVVCGSWYLRVLGLLIGYKCLGLRYLMCRPVLRCFKLTHVRGLHNKLQSNPNRSFSHIRCNYFGNNKIICLHWDLSCIKPACACVCFDHIRSPFQSILMTKPSEIIWNNYFYLNKLLNKNHDFYFQNCAALPYARPFIWNCLATVVSNTLGFGRLQCIVAIYIGALYRTNMYILFTLNHGLQWWHIYV